MQFRLIFSNSSNKLDSFSLYFKILALCSTVSLHIFKFWKQVRKFVLLISHSSNKLNIFSSYFKFQQQAQKVCSHIFNRFDRKASPHVLRFQQQVRQFILKFSNCSKRFDSSPSYFQILAIGSTISPHIFKLWQQVRNFLFIF